MANVENGALQFAIDNAAVGEIVVLTSDITLTSRVTVSNVVTIDLNGYSIKGDIDDGYGTIYIGTKGVLTIVDNSSKQIGSIINTVGNAIGNYGVVDIYGGTFIGNYALYNFYYSNSIYGISTIHGGTFKASDENSLAIVNCGNLTINGGTIETIDTTNVLTVVDGTIENLYVGVADYSPEKQNTSISGGHITSLTVADDSANEVAVSGGTFDVAIDNQYLADGVKFTYNEITGTYEATAKQGFKVIATSSSRVKDLVIKNGQLIFCHDVGRIAFDYKNKRTFYNQIVELETEHERQNLSDPVNGKYYFVIETAVFWRYFNEWIPLTKEPDEILFIGDGDFPELGQPKQLYVNKTEGNESISIFDEDKNEYHTVADRTYSISAEEISALF